MIPVSVMINDEGTVSTKIKGSFNKDRPSTFSSDIRPIVFWNITYKCNLNCKHCYINASPNASKEELDEEDLLAIAKEIIRLNLPLVIFTGGEPLIKKEFWSLAEVFSGYKRPKVSLSSNGTLLSKEYAKRLKDLGFAYVGVSLDSVKPDVHDSFRGYKGAFSLTLKGIRNAIDEGLDVGIRTTVTRWNVNEISEMVDFSAKLGAKRFTLYILDSIGRGVDISQDLPTKEQLKYLADVLIEKSKEYKSRLEILVVRGNFFGIYIAKKLSRNEEEMERYLKLLQSQGDCGRKTISIYPDGKVKPCQFIDKYDIGDLKKERLSDILSTSNPRLLKFIRLSDNLRGPKCSTCRFKHICGGGSRNRAMIINGDFWGDDPLCFV